jgi:CheY-like chemotaxis protein
MALANPLSQIRAAGTRTGGPGVQVLKILIVEDEPLLAVTLTHLIELNPLHSVTAIADDLAGTLEAVEAQRPDLALVDLQLANGTSGYSVAARLHQMGIACLFTTGKAPSFPVPDLALGCLRKPFEEEDLVRALTAAEDLIRGRQTLSLRRRLPEQLQIYSAEEEAAGNAAEWLPILPSARRSLKRRLTHWLGAH